MVEFDCSEFDRGLPMTQEMDGGWRMVEIHPPNIGRRIVVKGSR